jgi:hypothetical protein
MWQFNPYSAFVHMICGQKIFAFPTDDQDGFGGYFSAGADEEAVINLCPSAGSGPNSPGVMPASKSLSSSTTDSSATTTNSPSSSTTDSSATTTDSPSSSTTDSSAISSTAPIATESDIHNVHI